LTPIRPDQQVFYKASGRNPGEFLAEGHDDDGIDAGCRDQFQFSFV
jgi:hypothetical protein